MLSSRLFGCSKRRIWSVSFGNLRLVAVSEAAVVPA